MSVHKGAHPGEDGIEQPERERGGKFNRKAILLGTVAVIGIGGVLYSVAGITQEVEREKPAGLAPANVTARVPAAEIEKPAATAAAVPAEPDKKADVERKRERAERRDGRAEKKEKPNDNFKISTLAFANQHMGSVIAPLMAGEAVAQGSAAGGRRSAAGGSGGNGRAMAAGTGGIDPGASGGLGGGNAKSSFYAGGGGRSNQSLYHPHSLQPELEGCVLKAGDEIVIESPNPVRTELPGQVRGVVAEDAWGFRFLGGGRTEECLAVPAGSRTMAEVNAGGVSRGDLRIQMCATRIDLLGGGIMPMDCTPTLGRDGAFGVEAESDYQWGGVATGILIEAALSTVSALGGLIEGPAGVAVNVGTEGMRGVGSEYVNRELMKPPVLTMRPGAIYRIQVNADIAFPGE